MSKWIKKVFKGVSWQNKYIEFVFRMVDLPDLVIRRLYGLGELPKYSIRVRSTGVEDQFGGRQFADSGQTIVQLLIDHAQLEPEDKVIEIGCGCGRTALPLTRIIKHGNYLGLDINELSVAACWNNSVLKDKGFQFEWMDVHNPLYNPTSEVLASEYKIPHTDECADVILLISVFTHMMPNDIANYVNEISRLLRPNGRCFLTTFLINYGYMGGIDFPCDRGFYRLHQEKNPEKAVGYTQEFFERTFDNPGMSLLKNPLIGKWQQNTVDAPRIELGQDVMVFIKRNTAK